MPTKTDTLSWWDWRVAGWRCLGCGGRLGDGVDECSIDQPSPVLIAGAMIYRHCVGCGKRLGDGAHACPIDQPSPVPIAGPVRRVA